MNHINTGRNCLLMHDVYYQTNDKKIFLFSRYTSWRRLFTSALLVILSFLAWPIDMRTHSVDVFLFFLMRAVVLVCSMKGHANYHSIRGRKRSSESQRGNGRLQNSTLVWSLCYYKNMMSVKNDVDFRRDYRNHSITVCSKKNFFYYYQL